MNAGPAAKRDRQRAIREIIVRDPIGNQQELAERLVERDGVPARIDFTGARKPGKLVVIPLREGTGAEVESPDRVTTHYLGQVWGARKPFETSFPQEPASFSIGMSEVIKAWDRGLDGAKEGARVMIIAPPDLAYGPDAQSKIPANSTLVFVIDVLGA